MKTKTFNGTIHLKHKKYLIFPGIRASAALRLEGAWTGAGRQASRTRNCECGANALNLHKVTCWWGSLNSIAVTPGGSLDGQGHAGPTLQHSENFTWSHTTQLAGVRGYCVPVATICPARRRPRNWATKAALLPDALYVATRWRASNESGSDEAGPRRYSIRNWVKYTRKYRLLSMRKAGNSNFETKNSVIHSVTNWIFCMSVN